MNKHDKTCPSCGRVSPHTWIRFNPLIEGCKVWGYWCAWCWNLSTIVTDGDNRIVDISTMKPQTYLAARGYKISLAKSEQIDKLQAQKREKDT